MSTVIKVGESARPRLRLRTFDLVDHVEEARAIVKEGRRRAEELVMNAEVAAERHRAQSTQQGYAVGHESGVREGHDQGFQKAFSEAAERFNMEQGILVRSLTEALESVERMKEDLLIQARRDVLELAVSVAEKITMRLGVLDRSIAENLAAEAIRRMGERTDLILRIHPSDAETLRRFVADFQAALKESRHVALVEDDTMQPGGCVVSSPVTEVDARLETQLHEIAGLLLGDRKSECGSVAEEPKA